MFVARAGSGMGLVENICLSLSLLHVLVCSEVLGCSGVLWDVLGCSVQFCEAVEYHCFL